ncbi:MAG: phage tail protein [Dehalococcoidia bacterium]|nr:phage tail protein [Dehalococcoidia bacterium]
MRKDPLASFSFYVDIQGAVVGTFKECSGLGSETELIEAKETDKGRLVYMKMPGALKWENISLKRGITDSMDVWEWRKKVEEGDMSGARKNGSIIMYDQTNNEIARWNFSDGWPRKVSGPSFNAENNEIGIEELEIVHEGIARDH